MNTKLNIRRNRKQLPDKHLPIIGHLGKNFYSKRIVNNYLKFIIYVLLGFFVFTSSSANPIALSTKYKIYLFGSNIGEFSVAQTNNNGNINIEAVTEVKINLLFPYRIKYVQKTEYNQGVLQNAHVKTYKNGKLNSTMYMKLEKGSYLLITNSDTTTINNSITYSGSLLYFNEPNIAKKIFKERNAEMTQISPVSEHVYTINDEKGREMNKYYYEEGILQYATLRHALGNVELKRVKE